MAPRCDAKLLFCVLVIACCCYTVTEGQMVVDCCLRTSETAIDKRLVRDYKRQVLGQGCSIEAVIFETRKGIHLCAPTNRQWVDELMKHVDDLKVFCQKRKNKGNRCKGLKPK
ncbi:C-C motif chemokine 19-like [Myripristis murdjan]|uniref:C-C motif chemokine n=1 Tax=Myripristis murdjan TaxID=586833 RepID=A0A667Y5K7_9TELE|nr:C-C motif chemokine 19-like [Myripristis murdjan]